MATSSALGAFALGGISSADSLSVADPLSSILSGSLTRREYLLRATPGDNATGVALMGAPVASGLTMPAYFLNTGSNSFGLWVYLTNAISPTGAAGYLIAVGDDPTVYSRELYIDHFNHPVFRVAPDDWSTGGYITAYADSAIPAGKWVHIAGVLDTVNNLVHVMVNGVDATAPVSCAGRPFNGQAVNLYVGNWLGMGNGFAGRIAGDVFVYGAAITTAQVQAAMNSHLNGNETLLADAWPLDDMTGLLVRNVATPTRMLTLAAIGTSWDQSSPRPPVVASVDLSGSGYISQATDTPLKHFQPAIGSLPTFSVSLPVPALSGAATTSVSTPRVNNADQKRASDAFHDWLGANITFFLGRLTDPLTLFTPIINGTGSGVSRSQDAFTILMRDALFKLQRPLQMNKYGGFGAAIRHNGTDDYESNVAMVSPAGSMSMQAVATPTNAAITSHTVISWRNGTTNLRRIQFVGINDGLGINLTPIFDLRNDAGTLFSIDARIPFPAYKFPVGTRLAITAVLDVPNLLIHLYVNGVEAPNSPVAVTGTFNNTVTGVAIGRESDVVANFFAGVIDEVAVFNVVRSSDDVANSYNAPLTGTETGLVNLWHMDEGTGGLSVDTISAANLTLFGTGSPRWVGSLEGDSSIAGKPKPLAFGVRRQVAPVWVDGQNLIAQFHDGSMQAITAMKDKGDPAAYIFDGDVADIYATTPASGHYSTCIAMGLARFGSKPLGTITADIQGDNSGALGYQANITGIVQKILLQYCGWSLTDIDASAFATLAAAEPSVNGFYWIDEITRRNAINECFLSIWAWWCGSRAQAITCGRIPDPASSFPVAAISATDPIDSSKGGSWSDDPVSTRVGEVRVLYRPYQTVLTNDQVAGGLSLSVCNDLAQQYRLARAADPNRAADSDVLQINTSIDSFADAYRLALYILNILKYDRRLIKRSLPKGILSYFIGTVLSLTTVDGPITRVRNTVVVNLSENYGDSKNPDRLEVALLG